MGRQAAPKTDRRATRASDSGVALLAVLIGLGLLGTVAIAVAAVGIIEYQTSRDYLAATEARLVAEAGVTHAVALVGGPLKSHSFDELLIGADGTVSGNGASCEPVQQDAIWSTLQVAGTCQYVLQSDPNTVYDCAKTPRDVSYSWDCVDDGGDDGVLAGFAELTESDGLSVTGRAYGHGKYKVRLVNDSQDPSGHPFHDTNDRVVAVARGESSGGGAAEVKVILESAPYPAVVINGFLRLSANAQVGGECAGVHVNGTVEVGSNVIVDGPITADHVIHWYSDPAEIAKVKTGVPPIPVPEYDPLDHCADADYILRNGWKINVTAEPDSVSLGGGTDWSWSKASNTYKLGGQPSDLGTFCVHGNVSYTASIGTETEPVPITLLATGSVSLGGRSRIAPAHPDGLLIVSAGDVDIGGQAGARYSGLIYADNQCAFSGGPNIEAVVLCNDTPDEYSYEAADLLDYNEILNSTVISYDCSGPRRAPRVTSWWE